jgi:hypothetical protein
VATKLPTTTIPFRLRGRDGIVTVEYDVNEDPARWGYEELQQDWYSSEIVRGFPVMQAKIDHPAEGYAAFMGWIQVVRYEVRDPAGQETVTIVDMPPQLLETGSPYFSFGLLPTAFDAPAIVANDVTWDADTFLVSTPDALLSRVIRPTCGFRWGYRVRAGDVMILPLQIADPEDWERNRPELSGKFADWSFEDASSWAEIR